MLWDTRFVLLAAVLAVVPAASSGTLQWTFAGPNGAIGSSAGVTSGRVSAIVVDPRDRTGKTVGYASGAQGGVWKTIDGGAHWTPLTDTQPTLAIGSLALDPSNSDIVYAGTGEETFSPASAPAFGGAFYGMGVLKSTDAGTTWTLYNGPFAGPFGPTFFDGGARIGSLAVSPSNGQVILAAADFNNPAKSGIYRSPDGGATWSLVLGGASGTEVLFDPSSGSTTAWAALGDPNGNIDKNGVYRSLDGGFHWTRNFTPGSDAGRIRLAISSNGLVVYAGVHSVKTGGALGIWKTTNGGGGWGHLTNAPDYCQSACYYHNVIGVSPVNPSIVMVAGLTPRRSLDGGSTWTDLYLDKNGLTIHPDSHALAWSADGTRLYVGTDGGVYYTDDLASTPNTFTSLNATLGITQYYQGMSIHPTDPTITFAGSQDNGTQKSGSPQWQTVACGDGGRTLIDPTTPNTVYTSCAGGPLPQKSVDGGVTFSDSNTGIVSERTSFWAPFTMDPSNHARLYYGTYRVYVSNNAGASWTPISGDQTGPSDDPISAITTITVAPSSSDTVYTACGNDNYPPQVWVSTNATKGTSSTWTERNAGLPPRPPSQIAVDAKYPQVAYIGFMGFSGYNGDTAGHVFRTTNFGAAWTDISGDLPNTEVNDLLLDPDLPSTIYAATDIGVYWTLDGGVHWTPLGTGLPRMEVMALAMHQPSRTLRAATYGRSMWDLHIPLPSPVIPPGSIVNSAWPSTKAVAPGSIASLYGTSLALDTLLVPAPWPQTLGGASILTNGKPAAMYYVSPGQINFQVPWEAAGSTQGTVGITTGTQSATQSFNLAATAPGLFSTNQQGTGQAAALVANTAIVAAPTGMFPGSRPVKRGVEYLEFYGTGLGPVNHTPATGAPAPSSPLAQTIANATVTIGGVPATVSYCGLSPSYVGLYQVDVQVPANAPTGSAVAVILTIGGVAANTVTVAVQ